MLVGYFFCVSSKAGIWITGIVQGMGSADERRWNVTASLIGWARTENDSSIGGFVQIYPIQIAHALGISMA